MTPRVWLAKTALAASRSALFILATVTWLAGGSVWAWVVPTLRADLQQHREAMRQATASLASPRQATVAPTPSLAEARLTAFYDNLGELQYVEQQLKTLFAIAGKHNLSLSQGEYKRAYDKDGRFFTYRVILPVSGQYPAIRQFAEQVLLAVPFASLDELSFKRNTVNQTALAANLQLTLYLTSELPERDPQADKKGHGFE